MIDFGLPRSRTVKMLIVDPKTGKIILVYDKAKENGKHEAWGLPGGGIPEKDGEAEDIRKRLENQVLNFLPVDVYRENMSREALKRRLWLDWEEADRSYGGVKVSDSLIFWTAIKEGIEETGLLLFPCDVLLVDQIRPDHDFILVHAKTITGRLDGRGCDTKKADWFDVCSLPRNIHKSHPGKIKRGLRALGVDARVKRGRYVSV